MSDEITTEEVETEEEVQAGDNFDYSDNFDVFNPEEPKDPEPEPEPEPEKDPEIPKEDETGEVKKDPEQDDTPVDYEAMYKEMMGKNNELEGKVNGLLETVTSERERKRAAQVELENLRGTKKDEQTSFDWEDPNKTISEIDKRVDQKVQTMKLDLSESHCRSRHEDYDEKYKVFNEMAQKNPAIISQMLKQTDPAEWAYQFTKKQMSLSEIGSDPEAYKKSVEERVRAEVIAEMKGEKIETEIQKAAKTKIPPSGASIKGKTTGTDDVAISEDPLGDMWGPDR